MDGGSGALREAGIPDEVKFATKGELAQQMLTRAFAAGVSADWVVGDVVYGYDELRLFLEEQQQNYVVAVPETHMVWVQGRPQPVGYSPLCCRRKPGWCSRRERAAKGRGCTNGPGCSSGADGRPE